MKRKLIRKGVSLLLLAGMVLSVLIGCGKGEKTDAGAGKRISVTLNEVAHSIFYAPMYVAIEEGYFEEQGIDLTLVTGFGADKTMTAVLTREADIGFMGSEATIYTYAGGTQDYVVNFAQLTQRAGNFLVSRTDEPNFDWNNLKGKSIIGGRTGGMPEMVLEYVLKQKGLEIGKDVEIINNISFESTAGAFSADIGDYTVEFEPTASNLEASGKGHVVASLGTESGYVPYTVYMARKSYMVDNADTIQKFTNAIYKAQLWTDSHTSEEIAEAISSFFTESDKETLTKIVERYKSQDTWKTNPIFEENSLNLIEDIMENGNELEKRVPYSDLITTDFAEKAVKD